MLEYKSVPTLANLHCTRLEPDGYSDCSIRLCVKAVAFLYRFSVCKSWLTFWPYFKVGLTLVDGENQPISKSTDLSVVRTFQFNFFKLVIFDML